jgi:hypothetical protein
LAGVVRTPLSGLVVQHTVTRLRNYADPLPAKPDNLVDHRLAAGTWGRLPFAVCI